MSNDQPAHDHPDPTSPTSPEPASSGVVIPGELTSKRPTAPAAVVAIGGSAGALDGYERFFLSMPEDSGLAFVVVPHLDPNARGMMPELLARCTSMPVQAIEDGTALRPDQVYVLPPGKVLGILNGTLLLSDPPTPRASLPIDAFFENLAEDQGERAVAVVLSGMGSDGSRGVRAIRARMGQVYVQDPGSAQYDSMPQSALATGLATAVWPPEELAAHLYAAATGVQPLQADDLTLGSGAEHTALQKVLLQVRARTGQDFSQYKRSTLVRRIDRRMRLHALDDLGQYSRFLQDSPAEVDALFRDLLINVTSFFRDPDAFAALAEQLRLYLGAHQDSPLEVLRVWSAGCSTGEEAYSLAMLLSELLDDLPVERRPRVQIFASDIDGDAIEQARLGHYPEHISYVVSGERLRRFFRVKDGGYQVRGDLREMIVFAVHNTFTDPPFTRLDLVSCRNMLIYLNAELQRQVLALFHYALKPGALLFLGPSETLGSERDLYSPLNNRWKIFGRALGVASLPAAGQLSGAARVLSTTESRPGGTQGLHPPKEPDLSQLVQGILLSRWAPPAVVVTARGEIVYVSGRTGGFLELVPGKLNMNVTEMAREGLRYALAALLRQAEASGQESTHHDLRISLDGVERRLDLIVRPVRTPGSGPALYMIVFRDLGLALPSGSPEEGAGEAHSRVLELERELKYSKEYLQSTVEEMEVSLEELKSTNEELQSTNEELQSTNEELTTSKEELQSLNEELVTVNAEHQVIISDLAQVNDDMKNLLYSAGIATVFLDNEMLIKRFTPKITDVINLIPADIGRPISHISLNLRYDTLVQDVAQVLRTLVSFETEVQTHAGHWFQMRVSPYRTFENFINGVVIVFNNIDLIRNVQRQAQVSELYADTLVNALPDPLVVMDQDLRVLRANRALLSFLRQAPDQVLGQRLYDLGEGQFDQPDLHERLTELGLGGPELHDFLLDVARPGEGSAVLKVTARQVLSDDKHTELILLMLEDVSGILKRAEQEGVQGALRSNDEAGPARD